MNHGESANLMNLIIKLQCLKYVLFMLKIKDFLLRLPYLTQKCSDRYKTYQNDFLKH